MKVERTKNITLKHLFINNEKQIGLKFYPDKMIQTVIKGLPEPKWSNEFGMAYVKNSKENVDLIFKDFRGIAWLNCSSFFSKNKTGTNQSPVSVNDFRIREVSETYKVCPESYLLKLELKQYSLNTAKTYIQLFEKFINHYKEKEIDHINENDIRAYMQLLVHQQKSHSYINQMINSIKFYYEVVLEMPNRFYSIERPIKKESLPKVISLEEVQAIIKNTIILNINV